MTDWDLKDLMAGAAWADFDPYNSASHSAMCWVAPKDTQPKVQPRNFWRRLVIALAGNWSELES